jgi:bacterioferritin-associated ferredoxin
MIICQCKVVTTRCVTRALDGGASTTAQVCRHTRAGGDCGACVLTIKSLVTQHRANGRPNLDPVTSGGALRMAAAGSLASSSRRARVR